MPAQRGVRLGVLVGDVDDRVVVASVERAARALGMAPARTGRPRPPLVQVAEIDRPWSHREHERARLEVLGRRAGEVGRIERTLRDRHVPGRLDEGRVLPVRDLAAVDREPLDADAVDGRLLRVVPIGAHAELPARDRHEPGAAHGSMPEPKTLVQSRLMLTTVQPTAAAETRIGSACGSVAERLS